MDSLITSVAGTLGVPADLLRVAFCIIASFPLSSLVKRIPVRHIAAKEFVIFALGLFYVAGVFNLVSGALLMFILSFASYAFAALFPGRSWMPWANFGAQMAAMFTVHCYEQFGDGDFVNQIGISGSQMILLQKLTSFCWDVYDGTRPEAELNAHQKQSRITSRPSFVRFVSWAFFFPTIMTGPSCSFREYSDWVDLSMFKEIPTGVNKLPRSGAIVLGAKLAEGLLWVGLYTQTASIAFDPEFQRQQWYVQTPFLARVGYIYVMALVFRTKYYAAWVLAEAACIHAGLGYNGVNPTNGKLRWDRMQNVSALRVESSQNIHGVFANWNIITSKWLRYNVYERVTKPGEKPGTRSTFATFLVSAIWHGTRPGYYLTFITGAAYQTFGKLFRRQLRPVFVDTPFKKMYDITTWILTQLALSYAVVPFMVLDMRPALASWYSVYFYAHLGMLVSWFLLAGPAGGFIRPKLRVMHRDIKKTQ